jgi:hypothetical protein
MLHLRSSSSARTDGLRPLRLGHPKDSAKAQLLEAKADLQKMTAAIPLAEDEQAAVEDGQTAIDRLLGKLADTPTPTGPTPRQLATPGTGKLLPVISVGHVKTVPK